MKTLAALLLLVVSCDGAPSHLPDNLSTISPPTEGSMTLFETLAVTGHRKTDGSANASGRAWFYKPGTLNVATVYQDAAGTPSTNPVTLSAGGKARVYFSGQVDVFFEDFMGNPIETLPLTERAQRVTVENAGFNGTLASGSQGAGGVTDLDTILTNLTLNVGGLDGKYREFTGATDRLVGDKLREIWVSVKDYGALGDGIHDDTTNIQAALNEVARLGGGICYFPPGTYNLSAQLIVGQIQGLTIQGAGQRVTKVVQTNATQNGITIGVVGGASNDVIIENIQFAALTNASPIGVNFVNVNRSIVEASWVNAFSTAVSYTSGCAFPLITNNSVITGGSAGIGILMTSGSGLTVISSLVGAAFGPAVSLTTVTRATFLGVLFSNSTNGIVAASCLGPMTVIGCTLSVIGSPFVFTATDPGFTQVGNGVDGYTEAVLSGGNVAPDLTRGYSIRYQATTTGLAYNILAPQFTPSRKGVILRFELFNNVGGPIVGGWAFNAVYHRSASAVSLVDGHHTYVTFEFDTALNVWREISFSDST